MQKNLPSINTAGKPKILDCKLYWIIFCCWGETSFSRLPLEAPTFEEDEVVIVKEQTNGDTSSVENGERRKKKRESTVETEKKEEDGTNKLIKNWENGGQSGSSPQRQVKRRKRGASHFSVQVAAREKSPTLRMYSSADKEPGAKKRSVLDRLEDSKFSQSSPPKVFH